MLNLNNIRKLLSQVLSPGVRSAILFTPQGQLFSYASGPYTAKDEIRVIVGLSTEIWQETRGQGIGMVDSELGRLLVLPIDDIPREPDEPREKEDDPLMLLVLNSDNSIGWKILDSKAQHLAKHLERPVAELRSKLATAPASPITQRANATGR